MKKKGILLIKKLFLVWTVLAVCYLVSWQSDAQASPVKSNKVNAKKIESACKLYVHQFEFEGATVFSDQELSSIVASYLDREITSEDLFDARDALTHHYVDNGYINSRAFLPKMEISDGKFVMRIIEGRITGIKVSGNKRLRTGYIAPRLKQAIQFDNNEPLNINIVQERLKLFKKDPRIENITAKIEPQAEVQNAVLHIIVKEAQPYHAVISCDNHKPPAIGSYAFNVNASLINLTGWGDSLHGEWGFLEETDEYVASYTVPVSTWGATLSFGADRSMSTMTPTPPHTQNIVSQTETYSAALHHPFYKTLSQEFSMALQFDRRRNKTTDDSGAPYFLNPNVADNVSQASILRFSQEWVKRDLKQVFSTRSTFNFGLNLSDTTAYDNAYPDGHFTSWSGQFQWLQRMKIKRLPDNLLSMRLNLQLSDDPLLPMEKFAIGGSSSVRGYKENLMTTDNGVVGSFEWRFRVAQFEIPWFDKQINNGTLWLCPFFDIGRGWNADSPDPEPDEIYCTGLGLRGSLNKIFQFKLYWGLGLKDVADSSEYDIQKDGIHFEISTDLF
ncbi:ShlB/FhaC/HecB family hemolysin secretion/activation protein [Desulfococcaceae bacterium HSG9]|nr:ShlB/FhaC/HecB family hemolysin secretion/activation protein [Desulfococcaceae bacterium HSG9]